MVQAMLASVTAALARARPMVRITSPMTRFRCAKGCSTCARTADLAASADAWCRGSGRPAGLRRWMRPGNAPVSRPGSTARDAWASSIEGGGNAPRLTIHRDADDGPGRLAICRRPRLSLSAPGPPRRSPGQAALASLRNDPATTRSGAIIGWPGGKIRASAGRLRWKPSSERTRTAAIRTRALACGPSLVGAASRAMRTGRASAPPASSVLRITALPHNPAALMAEGELRAGAARCRGGGRLGRGAARRQATEAKRACRLQEATTGARFDHGPGLSMHADGGDIAPRGMACMIGVICARSKRA